MRESPGLQGGLGWARGTLGVQRKPQTWVPAAPTSRPPEAAPLDFRNV